jgi:putative ABC transport system permease protein
MLDRDMDEEMRAHLEMETHQNLERGMSPDEARFAAHRAFGGMDQLQERERDARGWRWLRDFLGDARFGVRILIKNPGFSCTTILILALGIGGVTAMFSTLYAVMIRPLPYLDPGRLVLGRATFSGDINPWVSGPNYVDYRDQSQSFSALEAFFCLPIEVTTTDGATAVRAKSLLASTGLFSTLGVKMSSGRTFIAEEGEDRAPPVAIVSHAYWQKHFAGKSDVAGQSVVIDGVSHTLVGVTRADFHFLQDVDVWLPLRPQKLGPRRFNQWLILGRLRDGVTLSQAQSEVGIVASRLERAYPDTNANEALLLTPLQSAFTEQYRSSFAMLCAGAGAILLIACANAAGLLLARGAGRHGEFALRMALGASSGRLMRMLMTEVLILSCAAGAAGVVLAVWMQHGLLLLMPIETLLLRDVGLSRSVLFFVLAITVPTGLGFGLLPALRARQVNLAQDLRSSGRGPMRRGNRLRRGLVVGQVAISFVLLVAAGLLIRSLDSLQRAELGFNPQNLMTAEVPLPPQTYPYRKSTAFFSSLLEKVRALPGVVSAAAISQLPLRDPYNNVDIYAAASPPASSKDNISGYQRVVLPSYFKTMGIPLLAGRDIEESDLPDAHRVIVISQRLAETLFPHHNPLGQGVVIDRGSKMTWEVVGVVGDVKQSNLREGTSSFGTFYRAPSQQPWSTMRLAIRTAGDPRIIAAPLSAILRRMDTQVPLSNPFTMEEVISNSTVSEKAQTYYLTAFSMLALNLAAVGIHGLLAFVVTQQRHDIGIRMALGATRRNVAWGILHEAAMLAVAGLVVGGLGALGATQLVRASLYGVGPSDPLTLVVSASALLLAAGLAAWLPAWRATRVNPIETLRSD